MVGLLIELRRRLRLDDFPARNQETVEPPSSTTSANARRKAVTFSAANEASPKPAAVAQLPKLALERLQQQGGGDERGFANDESVQALQSERCSTTTRSRLSTANTVRDVNTAATPRSGRKAEQGGDEERKQAISKLSFHSDWNAGVPFILTDVAPPARWKSLFLLYAQGNVNPSLLPARTARCHSSTRNEVEALQNHIQSGSKTARPPSLPRRPGSIPPPSARARNLASSSSAMRSDPHKFLETYLRAIDEYNNNEPSSANNNNNNNNDSNNSHHSGSNPRYPYEQQYVSWLMLPPRRPPDSPSTFPRLVGAWSDRSLQMKPSMYDDAFTDKGFEWVWHDNSYRRQTDRNLEKIMVATSLMGRKNPAASTIRRG